MKPLEEEIKKKLRESGREDLIEIHEILMKGNGAILPNGNIVDKTKYPDAIPIPPNNPFLNIHPEKAAKNYKDESRN